MARRSSSSTAADAGPASGSAASGSAASRSAASRSPRRPSSSDPDAATIEIITEAGADAVRVVPRQLPRGIGGLPQDVVVLSQRARLVEGTARAVADKGYAATAVADIIGHAGVSRTTFYQLFRDKEDCFLACFEGLARAQLAVVTEVLDGEGELAESLLDGLQAYLRRIDADHWYARAFIAEAQAATPRIRAAFDAARDRLDALVRGWFVRVRDRYPQVPPCADATYRLLQAALEGHVVARVRAGDRELAAQAPLIAALVFAALGLYGWAETARRGERRFGDPCRIPRR